MEQITHRLLDQFKGRFGSTKQAIVARAPGRVNLIGDHTDYNDGFVFPMSIDRGVYAVVRKRSDGLVRIFSVNFDEETSYPLAARPETVPGSWQSYVTGVVEELRLGGSLVSGFEMLIFGDVPLGAGLSSSAALETAVIFSLDTVFALGFDPLDAVRLGQTVEHQYAGVQCGIMDQFASRIGRRGHALFLDCRTLEYEHVPLALSESGLALVIADSRVSRELAQSTYGDRRSECDRVVEIARLRFGDMRALRDLDPDRLEQVAPQLSDVLYRRARHVIEENIRVIAARNAVRAGDFEIVGRLMNESHRSLRDLFEVSAPELDLLVATAQDTEGVLGARMTGGGFGGCTVNLVRKEAVPRLERALWQAYEDAFGREPHVYVLKQNHQTELLYDEG